VIIEDKRGIDIDFNLTANFEIKDTSLAAATVNTNNTSADVSSYIESCKCSPNSFACNTDDLDPNERLFVCIYSQSTDVGIASLESMVRLSQLYCLSLYYYNRMLNQSSHTSLLIRLSPRLLKYRVVLLERLISS